MSIENVIMSRVINSIDLSQYETQIKEAVKEYFDSESFRSDVASALIESSVAWEIGQEVSEKISKQIKKLNISVSLK